MRTTIKLIALVVVGASCGAPPGGEDAATSSDAGDSGVDAASDPVDCGGGDALEVRTAYVDDVLETTTAIAGATVALDCAAGRLVATSDADGMVRFNGLDLAGDPPSVTAFARGHPVRTRIAVPPEAALRPLVFRMNGTHDTRAPRSSVTVSITYAHPTARAYCWHTGREENMRHHHSARELSVVTVGPTYSHPWFRGPRPQRVSCLELDAANGVLGYAEAPIADDGTAAVDLTASAPIERFELDVERHPAYEAGRVVRAWVRDFGEGELDVAIGQDEGVASVGELLRLSMAWAPSAVRGAPEVELHFDGNRSGWLLTRRVDELTSAPVRPRPPPSLASLIDLDGDRLVEVSDAEWADEVALFMNLPFGGNAWTLIAPASLSSFRLPDPPPGTTDASIGLDGGGSALLVAFDYRDRVPPPDHWVGRWYVENLREGSYRYPVPYTD